MVQAAQTTVQQYLGGSETKHKRTDLGCLPQLINRQAVDLWLLCLFESVVMAQTSAACWQGFGLPSWTVGNQCLPCARECLTSWNMGTSATVGVQFPVSLRNPEALFHTDDVLTCGVLLPPNYPAATVQQHSMECGKEDSRDRIEWHSSCTCNVFLETGGDLTAPVVSQQISKLHKSNNVLNSPQHIHVSPKLYVVCAAACMYQTVKTTAGKRPCS